MALIIHGGYIKDVGMNTPELRIIFAGDVNLFSRLKKLQGHLHRITRAVSILLLIRIPAIKRSYTRVDGEN